MHALELVNAIKLFMRQKYLQGRLALVRGNVINDIPQKFMRRFANLKYLNQIFIANFYDRKFAQI